MPSPSVWVTRTAAIIATMVASVAVMAVAVHAQSSSSTLRGSWAARAGPTQIFQGTWTAQWRAEQPDIAQGTWTLINPSNQIVAQGTWSAVKTARSWSGTWQARFAGTDRILSGSWRTQLAATDVRTLSDMLQRTLQEQVSGTWASGRLSGSWSLRAFP